MVPSSLVLLLLAPLLLVVATPVPQEDSPVSGHGGPCRGNIQPSPVCGPGLTCVCRSALCGDFGGVCAYDSDLSGPGGACNSADLLFCETGLSCAPNATCQLTVSKIGGPCGGNTVHPPQCATGLQCLNLHSMLPVQEIGGSCMSVVPAGATCGGKTYAVCKPGLTCKSGTALPSSEVGGICSP